MLVLRLVEEKINQILQKYSDQIAQAENLKKLDEIYLALFGKNGEITLLPKEFPKLEKDQLKVIAPLFNKTKNELEKSVDQKRSEVREEGYKKLANEDFDLEKAQKIELGPGHLHPQTQFEKEIADLFESIGFAQYDSPHIDSDFNNFEVLNIPEDHPARDLWDTLYLEDRESKVEGRLLLRTHTSNSQIRIMQNFKPPIRMMDIGRCFRYENIDARHEHTFDQFEIVVVEKGLSMANLLYLSNYFLKNLFGSEIKARLRPKYYPFVEPGAGVDGLCMFCKGKARLPDGQGCKVCGGVGWLELAGAGMIHPQVLKNGGIDPEQYSGIAWGTGLGRMMMLKYGIEDIRLLNSGDLNFLEKF